jgi:hypothetical protein
MIKDIKIDNRGLIKILVQTNNDITNANNSMLIIRERCKSAILYNSFIKNNEIYFKIEKHRFNNNNAPNIINKSLINLLKSIDNDIKILNVYYDMVKIDYNKLLLNLNLPIKYYNNCKDYKNIISDFIYYYKYNNKKISGFTYFFPID